MKKSFKLLMLATGCMICSGSIMAQTVPEKEKEPLPTEKPSPVPDTTKIPDTTKVPDTTKIPDPAKVQPSVSVTTAQKQELGSTAFFVIAEPVYYVAIKEELAPVNRIIAETTS